MIPRILAASILAISCKSQPKPVPVPEWEKMPDVFAANVPDSLRYLLPILDTVFLTDQKYRYGLHLQPKEVQKQMMKEMSKHADEIAVANERNVRIISGILDRYGFLSFKDVGIKGQMAITMTIQHANLETQRKYVALFHKAVMEKKLLTPSTYAMLEDRIAIKEGRSQLYGTQIAIAGSKVDIIPIYRPEELDKRRSLMRMLPYDTYLKTWHLKWDAAEYVKRLPILLTKYKITDTSTVPTYIGK